MLNEILDLAKNEIASKLSSTGLSKEQLDQSVQIAGDSITDGLKSEAKNNNLEGILGLFNGKSKTDASNPIVSNISSNAIQNITSKLGISSSIASTVVSAIVPFILSKLSGKLGGNSESIMSGLSGMLGVGGFNLGSLGDFAKSGLGDKLKDLF